MPKKVTISINASDRASLENLAKQFGCLWGSKPNISELISRIAQDKIKLESIDAVLCPKCSGKAYKNGFNGTVQKYYCSECDRSFQLEKTPQDKRQKRKISASQMAKLQSEGKSLEQIAKVAGISREGVRLAIKVECAIDKKDPTRSL